MKVLGRPVLEHLLRDVERVVVDGVSFHPQSKALDERRPGALARLLYRRLRLAVDGKHVGAFDDHAVEAVRGRTVGDVLDRVAEVRRCRVRPLVVVADEDDRELRAPARFIPSCASPALPLLRRTRPRQRGGLHES